MRIVLGNSTIASYPSGAGNWMIVLQSLLGLKDLGHDVFFLGVLKSQDNPHKEELLIDSFFERLKQYDLDNDCALLVIAKGIEEHNLELATIYGSTKQSLKEIISSADMLWNECGNIRQPLLGMFRHRVLLDGDPGHVQVSALTVNMGFQDHQTLFTVGRKIHDADSEVPMLNLKWQTFNWFVYLPLWQMKPDPGFSAPFSSITHWNWGELWMEDRVLGISKRDAYLRYVDLPQKTRRPFELAVHIDPTDETGDRELLISNGWKLVDPWEVADSPSQYEHYIERCRAEISCPKPIFRELKTGWFSDRSACFLASGRPVLAEDTGVSDYFPTGNGLLVFRDLESAIDGVAEIDANYEHHSQAAREFTEEFLDSRKVLKAMLESCS